MKKIEDIIIEGIKNKKSFSIHPTNFVGCVEVRMEVLVKDFPEQTLRQMVMDDEPMFGCPHHYGLNEEKTEVQYLRHGTSCWNTETGNLYVEKTYTTVGLKMQISPSKLNKIIIECVKYK